MNVTGSNRQEGRHKISVMQVIYALKTGGSEKLAVTISSHLDRSGFSPSVCALDLDGELAEDLERDDIPHHVLFRKGIEPAVIKRMYDLINKNNIDIVHTHHFTQLFYTILAAKMANVKIVHTEHEYYSYTDSLFSQTMIKVMSYFCNHITVVGPEVADYFVNEIGIKRSAIRIIASGVDIKKFDVPANGIRNEIGLQEGEVVFGTVGRLEKEKDHRALFDSFKLVEKTNPHVRLLVVGEGSLREELESYAKGINISNKLHFLGYRRDIPELLSAIDVFVLSSINEGLPIAVIEAMAAGKPVISTNVGSLGILVRNDVNGLLVNPGNVAEIASAMNRLCENSELRREMGKKGKEIAVESFGLSNMVRRYEEIYDSLMSGNHVRN